LPVTPVTVPTSHPESTVPPTTDSPTESDNESNRGTTTVKMRKKKRKRSDTTGKNFCHRQIFGRETLSDLTAKSNAIEIKRGIQVLYAG
jgi:hypothetical protein